MKGEGNHIAFEGYGLDVRTGRRFQIDPLISNFPGQSSYMTFFNNPLKFIDPTGMEPEGDYYGKDGKWLGTDNKQDGLVYTAESVTKNNEGVVVNAKNSQKLSVEHNDFKYISGVVSKEDSSTFEGAAATAQATFNAVKLVKGSNIPMNNQSALASDLLASDYSSVPNKEMLETTNSSKTANNSRAGLIHVLLGGVDYSNGAVAWDGVDFAIRGTSHPKGKDGGFTISENLWTQFTSTYNWASNDGKGIKYKGKYYDKPASLSFTNGIFDKLGTGKYASGNVAYKASAVYGQHIFWAPNKGDTRNKGYNFKYLASGFFK